MQLKLLMLLLTLLFNEQEEIQNTAPENSMFGDTSKVNKGNYPFGAPQMSQTSSVFGQKTFGAASNPFGNSSTFNSTQASSSIFARTNPNNAASVFGGKPSFGGTSVFGGQPAAGSSIFGGTKTASAPFGAVQNAPTFGALATQGM